MTKEATKSTTRCTIMFSRDFWQPDMKNLFNIFTLLVRQHKRHLACRNWLQLSHILWNWPNLAYPRKRRFIKQEIKAA